MQHIPYLLHSTMIFCASLRHFCQVACSAYVARRGRGNCPSNCLLVHKQIYLTNFVTLFVTNIHPECHKWGTKQKNSARSIVAYPILKMVALSILTCKYCPSPEILATAPIGVVWLRT